MKKGFLRKSAPERGQKGPGGWIKDPGPENDLVHHLKLSACALISPVSTEGPFLSARGRGVVLRGPEVPTNCGLGACVEAARTFLVADRTPFPFSLRLSGDWPQSL